MTALPRVAAAAALAVVYIGLAYTGWTVGSLPGSVSPVWPATGLAVVMALRLRGAGVAAVGLGELVANLTQGWESGRQSAWR